MPNRTTAGGELIIDTREVPAMPGRKSPDDVFDENLSKKQNAAYFYALGRQITHLCKVCGLAERTFYKWKAGDDDFKEMYEAYRTRLVEHGYNKARMRVVELIDSQDENISLRAALGLMQHVTTLAKERRDIRVPDQNQAMIVVGDVLSLGSEKADAVLARGREQLAKMEGGKAVTEPAGEPLPSPSPREIPIEAGHDSEE
ncbi:MAG: hypothetical protein HN396_04445 [Gemmatimonadales bacterium]|jgi:hypothetical protein|nr:hypothetical protein [Gemmatimonadales bacterium]